MDCDTRRNRWKQTQAIDVDWKSILDSETYKGIQNCSLSTGTPFDFYAMPLLSTASSLMNEATVIANQVTGWREPSIIWSVISAPAGMYYFYINSLFKHGHHAHQCGNGSVHYL